MTTEIYQEQILDYWKNPRNFGDLENPDIKSRDANPLCGDVVEIQLKINGNKVTDVKFKGEGCVISKASASMLTELIKGKTLDELVELDRQDILNLLQIELSPIRLKCAMLPLKALKLGVYSYLGKV